MQTNHLLITTLLLLAILPSQLVGQGTSGILPDPISSRELSHFAEMIGLNQQQRLAIQDEHDAYRQAFRTLRETKIEQFLSESGNMRGGLGMLMDRERLRANVEQIEQLTNAIEKLDGQLFAQMQTVLSEEQLLRLNRVRQSRERARYQTGLTRFARFANPAAQIDLSALLIDLEVPAEAMRGIDEPLQAYERKLTTYTRDMYESTSKLAEELFDRLDAAGFSAESFRGRQRGDFYAAFESIYAELMRDLVKESSAVSRLNRRTIVTLEQHLPEDAGRQLRDAYYLQAYAQARSNENPAIPELRRVIDRTDITSATQDTLQQMLQTLYARTDRITEEAADLIDDNRLNRDSVFRGDSPQQQEFNESLTETHERRKRVNRDTQQSLASVLASIGADGAADRLLDEASQDMAGNATGQPANAHAHSGQHTNRQGNHAQQQEDQPLELDLTLFRAISRQELSGYARTLELGDELNDIVDSMHGDYLTAFGELKRSHIQPIRDRHRRVWGGLDASQPDPNWSAPESAQIEELYHSRRESLNHLLALDRSLLEDLAALSASDTAVPLERVTLARQRSLYRRALESTTGIAMFPGDRGSFSGDKSHESLIDMAALLETVTLTPPQREGLNPSLLEYERDITMRFRDACELHLIVQRELERVQANVQTRLREQGGRVRWRDYRSLHQGEGQRLIKMQEELARLNRLTLSRLQADLPADQAQSMSDAYHQAAFPDLYDDPQNAQPTIRQAMKLEDLTDRQRQVLAQITAEYRAGYQVLCRQMVAIRRTADEQVASGGAKGWQVRMEQDRNLERLRSDRDDLNHKATLQLRTLLTQEQAFRLGLDS